MLYISFLDATIFSDERFGTSGYISDFQQISCSSDASENHMSNCSIIYKRGCGQGGYSCWNEKGIKCFSKSIGHSY